VENMEEKEEELSTEELVNNNDIMLNALIELLIEKGVITEEELEKKADDISEPAE
jgi:hypothetical protein